MKGRVLISIVSALLCCVASAQMRLVPREKVEDAVNPRLSSDSASVHFGTRHIVAGRMNEDDAPATFRFGFTNAGPETIEIRRIVTTCSCASAMCPVSSVAPGESSEIMVRYDPKGHPGRFERRIFVYTQDGSAPAAVLRLSVDVESGSDLSTVWPVQMGGIRMRTALLRISSGRKAVEKLRFINVSDGPLKLGCEEAFLPECLSFRTEPSLVEPGQEGDIIVTYDPDKPGAKENIRLILKGLGLPPSRSAINIVIN